VEPAEPGALVAAQLAPKPGRGRGRRDARELLEAPAGKLEGFVDGDLGLVRQPGVEQHRLPGSKA